MECNLIKDLPILCPNRETRFWVVIFSPSEMYCIIRTSLSDMEATNKPSSQAMCTILLVIWTHSILLCVLTLFTNPTLLVVPYAREKCH